MQKHNTLTNYVPCNGCVACCQGDLIVLHPELGDDPTQYETTKVGNLLVLAHKDDSKDCIYLDRERGCTIYDKRPAICRSLDCRILLSLSKRDRRYVSRRVLGAARRLVGKHGNPWAHLRKG